jgi:hypothetical protein
MNSLNYFLEIELKLISVCITEVYITEYLSLPNILVLNSILIIQFKSPTRGLLFSNV